MWQRIQTLFLALSTGLMVTLLFGVKSFTLGEGGAMSEEFRYAQSIPHLILIALTVLLQLLALGTFKVRVFQMRTAVLSALLMVALQAWLAVDYLTADDSMVFKFTLVFPLVSALLNLLAARCILRDQLLVESSSRLRSGKRH